MSGRWSRPAVGSRAEAWFRRLLLEDEEEALRRCGGAAAGVGDAEVEAEESHVVLQRAAEDRIAFVGRVEDTAVGIGDVEAASFLALPA